jgi:hypothetical protein
MGDISTGYSDQLTLVVEHLVAHEQYAAAKPLLRESLQLRTKTQPAAWATSVSKFVLGICLLGQKKYANAQPLLKQGYEGMKQRKQTIPPAGQARVAEAVERLVQLYEAQKNPVEAERWRKELAARKAAAKDAKKRETSLPKSEDK